MVYVIASLGSLIDDIAAGWSKLSNCNCNSFW